MAIKFSICIPAHRLDRRLRNTISQLSQLDFPRENIEICLLINGDQSKNKHLIKKFTEMVDMYEIIRGALGPSEAKNKAINLAKNEWIVLLDSDDFLVPSALKQYESMINSNPDLLIGYELSIINFINNQKFFPPSGDEYLTFLEEQKVRAYTHAACGRPVLINKKHFLGFDTYFGFAEERKLACDYWNNNKAIHIMTTSSYVYNCNDTGIKKDEQSLIKIKELAEKMTPNIHIAKYDNYLTYSDIDFIDKVFFLEVSNI